MSASSGTIALRANRGGAVSGINLPVPGSIQETILNHVKGLAVRKVWATVADVLGLSERSAKHRLAGTRAFTADELAHLLRQEQGLDLLVAVIGEARPKWWVRFLEQREIINARADAMKAKRRLHKLLDAVDGNAALLDRAETALCVQDEEFGRAQFAGYRASARPADRTVVRKR